ncbi:MAG: hypothetical protein ACP5OR_02435 [Candidatus Dormibacteria bacterium]
MKPDSSIVRSIGALVDQLNAQGIDSSRSRWLGEQKSLLIESQKVGNIEAALKVLEGRLGDLYESVVVTDGHHDLRSAFASLIVEVTTLQEQIKSGKYVPDPPPAPKTAQVASPPAGNAASGEENEEGESNAVRREDVSRMGLIGLVTAAIGLVFIFVAIATLSVLPAGSCSLPTTATKTWLGLVGSLVFGMLTIINQSIENQRQRRIRGSSTLPRGSHTLQLFGIIQIGLFGLVVIVLHAHGCSVL